MHFSINQIPAMSKSKTSDYVNTHRIMHLLQGRSVGSVSASRTIGREFASRPGHTKDQLSKMPGSVWNCLWGNALKRSPGIIRKSRVSYPIPGFLSSATWPSLPIKENFSVKRTPYKIVSRLT